MRIPPLSPHVAPDAALGAKNAQAVVNPKFRMNRRCGNLRIAAARFVGSLDATAERRARHSVARIQQDLSFARGEMPRSLRHFDRTRKRNFAFGFFVAKPAGGQVRGRLRPRAARGENVHRHIAPQFQPAALDAVSEAASVTRRRPRAELHRLLADHQRALWLKRDMGSLNENGGAPVETSGRDRIGVQDNLHFAVRRQRAGLRVVLALVGSKDVVPCALRAEHLHPNVLEVRGPSLIEGDSFRGVDGENPPPAHRTREGIAGELLLGVGREGPGQQELYLVARVPPVAPCHGEERGGHSRAHNDCQALPPPFGFLPRFYRFHEKPPVLSRARQARHVKPREGP